MAKPSICSIENCGKDVWVHHTGYCRAHYLRWLRYGDPLKGGKSLSERGAPLRWMQQHVSFLGVDCLLYPHARTGSGYGALVENGKRILAHRWMCEAVHGPAPFKSAQVAHSCGNGHAGCVNPAHLRWATHAENVQDRDEQGRTLKGNDHPIARLTEAQVVEIYKQRGLVGGSELGRQYGVSHCTIDDIWAGRSWAWLTGENGGRNPRRVGRYKKKVSQGAD